MIVWTCDHNYFVFVGATEPQALKSRGTNDPSGGFHVLVAGIVMIPTVGGVILREGTASMHTDEIDVKVSAISQRWDLAMSVCSEYFFLVET